MSNIPLKRCTGPCGQEYPATTEYWHKHTTGKYGLKAKCKKCFNEISHAYYESSYEQIQELRGNNFQKKCNACEKYLPSSEFQKGRGKYGLRGQCKKCSSEANKKNRSIDATRKNRLRKKFGLTPEQYNQMLEAQGGVCAACGNPETFIDIRLGTGSRILSVDHDHITGEVRALLCAACNVSLGKMGEDPIRIRALADYAEWCKTRNYEKVIQISLIN